MGLKEEMFACNGVERFARSIPVNILTMKL